MTFTDLLKDYGIPFLTEGDHHCTVGWVQMECPFCGKGSGVHHLGFNLSTKVVNCWKCGAHSPTEVLHALTNESWKKCKELTNDLHGGKAPDRPAGRLELPRGRGQLLKAHRKYLKRRGFDPTHLEQLWKLEGIGLAPALSWRIFIPIIYQGAIVSWTTRSISDYSSPRYRSAKGSQETIPHKTLLYGEDYCRHACIVHEGPIDAWATGPGAVAICGLGYSRAQLLRIAKYPVRVICFDNEPEAQRRAQKLCNDLLIFEGETYNVVLSGKDPASSPKSELKTLRRRFLE